MQWSALLRDLQAELASLSPNSFQVVVSNSTHVMQLDQPGVVVAAIREVVTAAKEKRALRPISSAAHDSEAAQDASAHSAQH